MATKNKQYLSGLAILAKDAKMMLDTTVETNDGVPHLPQNVVEIINLLGGFNNVLQLCLTHPDANDLIPRDNINELEKLLKEQIPRDINYSCDDDQGGATRIRSQSPSISKNNSVDSPIGTNDHENKSIDHHTYNYPSNSLVIRKLIEYYTDTVIIVANRKNNLYFRYLSHEKASFIVYQILMSKWYSIASFIVMLGFIFGSIIYHSIAYNEDNYMDSNYLIFLKIETIVAIAWFTTLCFAADLQVIQLICQTFDFWFKISNYVVLLISTTFFHCYAKTDLNPFRMPTIDFILVMICYLALYLYEFLSDSFVVSPKMKQFWRIIIALWCIFSATGTYFRFQDEYWNPFKSYNIQETRINFKSLYISSMVNICIFVLKPIFSQFGRRLRAKCLTKDRNVRQSIIEGSNNVQDTKISLQRSAVIYKKAKIHWID